MTEMSRGEFTLDRVEVGFRESVVRVLLSLRSHRFYEKHFRAVNRGFHLATGR
jgi:hypothetical protein